MTAKQRVLDRLLAANGDWVPGLALADPRVGGLRFGARLHELKAEGYDHETRHDPRSKVPQYRLIIQPKQLTMDDVA